MSSQLPNKDRNNFKTNIVVCRSAQQHVLPEFFKFFFPLLTGSQCEQTLYKFVPEHCEVTYLNESLMHTDEKKCFKVSRTELYFNISFSLKVDILNDDMGQAKWTGYRFRNNVYTHKVIEFMMGLCTFCVSKDFDIPHMLSNSNLKCPLLKGHNYYVYKLSPNATNMPPLIPEGRWMFQLDFLYMNKFIIWTIKWYTGIEYDPLFKLPKPKY